MTDAESFLPLLTDSEGFWLAKGFLPLTDVKGFLLWMTGYEGFLLSEGFLLLPFG